MKPGTRTINHPFVGRRFRLFASRLEGTCVSVTPWGNDRIRWVRLRHDDGTEKSYGPSYLVSPP